MVRRGLITKVSASENFPQMRKILKKAFCNALHNLGIVFNRGRVVIVDDGDILEAQNRKDGEPLFVAIPMD